MHEILSVTKHASKRLVRQVKQNCPRQTQPPSKIKTYYQRPHTSRSTFNDRGIPQNYQPLTAETQSQFPIGVLSKLQLLPGPSNYKTRLNPSRGFSRLRQQVEYTIQDRMKSVIHFITVPTADTSGTALLLHFDDRRYIIGQLGEGTQRSTIQQSLSLGKVNNVFITGQTYWKNTGGILGLLLTLADVQAAQRDAAEGARKAVLEREKKQGKTSSSKPAQVPAKRPLTIAGGRNITHLLATARRFIFRKGLPLETIEFEEETTSTGDREPDWSDDRIRVWNLPLSPETPARSRKRSHEEFATGEEPKAKVSTTEKSAAVDDDQIRKAVVGQMFNSDWQLDALFPTQLKDVKKAAGVFIRDEKGHIQPYKGPVPWKDSIIPDIEVLVRRPWPAALTESLPKTTPTNISTSYIVRNHPQRGKFLVKKAEELQVQPKSLYNKLTSGQSVTLEDGRVITPDMVLAPGKPGAGFVVLDIPTSDYIESALKREEWASEKLMEGVGAFIWLLGPGVLQDSRLEQFMRAQSKYEHIVSSSDCCPNVISQHSYFRIATFQNNINKTFFPIPDHSSPDRIAIPADAPYLPLTSRRSITLEPNFALDERQPDIHDHSVEYHMSHAPGNPFKLAREIQAGWEALPAEDDIPNPDAEVIALGTGSALPSKYRNVSATLLRVPGVGNYLLDCGENTIGQLRRAFGAEFTQVLRELKGIWISHLHADHHLGTASVIKAWHQITANDPEYEGRRLLVASDAAMLDWLDEYSQMEDIGHSRVLALRMGQRGRLNQFLEEFHPAAIDEFGLKALRVVPVSHCHGALAVILDFPSGLRVAYSGDCRPSEIFASFAKGATLLIHEATFVDELAGDAIAKKHSTVSEAMEIAKQMRAKRVFLTHFSQRYPGAGGDDESQAAAEASAAAEEAEAALDGEDNAEEIEALVKQSGAQAVKSAEGSSEGPYNPPTVYALDFMRVRLGDFSKLQTLRPALVDLYNQV